MSRRSTCPIALTLDLVGDRWTLLVVRDLVLGKTRFDEFLKSPEKIATNILSSRLGRLKELGFIEAKADEKDRRRVHYELTTKGDCLRDLVTDIAQWGLTNCESSTMPAEARHQLQEALQQRRHPDPDLR